MKKISEYRQHAKECRSLANQAFSEEHRKQLLAMAESWEVLALEREKAIAKDDTSLAVMASRRSGRNGSGTNGSGCGHTPY